MDNVGIVVESLDAAVSFFEELGLELEGRFMIEGDWSGRVTGLRDQRVEVAMMRMPDEDLDGFNPDLRLSVRSCRRSLRVQDRDDVAADSERHQPARIPRGRSQEQWPVDAGRLGNLDGLPALHGPHQQTIGLDRDFRGIPFGAMPRLLALADQVTKLTAICVVCGEPATRTQRLIDGEPAGADSPLIVIGGLGDETYEARCRLHHVVPGLDGTPGAD